MCRLKASVKNCFKLILLILLVVNEANTLKYYYFIYIKEKVAMKL